MRNQQQQQKYLSQIKGRNATKGFLKRPPSQYYY